MNINVNSKTRLSIQASASVCSNMASSYSTRDLDLIPSLTFSFIEQYIKSIKQSSGDKSMNKGFQYFSEGYIHDLTAIALSEESEINGKCYHSEKKNEPPHRFKIVFKRQDPPIVTRANCSCPIGLSGGCGHVTAALYQLAKYKLDNLKAIPEDIAKTSQPQTWHIPRGEKIRGKAAQALDVRGYKRKTEDYGSKSITSTLYNPLRGEPIDWTVKYQKLSEATPNMLMLSSIKSTSTQMVSSKFGLVPRGSVLSYQQPLESACIINLYDGIGFPDLPASNFMHNSYSVALTSSQMITLEGLKLSMHEVHKFEKETRLQSESPLWFKLRKHRITASKAGEIFKRRKDFDTLSKRLKSNRRVVTAAMRQGLASEPTAARKYSEVCHHQVNLYPCGVVVSPWAPWIAASPDRKVYHPESFPPFGLLEIKCPQVQSVLETQYLKKDDTATLKLNRNHQYYFQILTQLAVTGLQWCDLFVWCENDYHQERIYFNEDLWKEVKNKIDMFYFSSFI